jgi:CPA2 family monovalent cation:H+ antiporter-2
MTPDVAPGGYKDLVLFLATAGVVAPLFKRLRISPILGFLAAGVALGPYGLGRASHAFPWLAALSVSNPAEIAQLSRFGVAFLLFSIAIELSWERIRMLSRLVFGLGALQLVGGTVVLGGGAMLFGQPIEAAATLGVALALSSTALVIPALAERRRERSAPGRAIFSVLLAQDLAVAPILVLVGVLGRRGGIGAPGALLAFLTAIGGLAGLAVVGRVVLRPMLKSVARAKNQEMFMAAALLVVIGSSLAAALAGLSMSLGAFVAGLLLAETEYRHEVEVTVAPFRGLLLGLFFVSVGMGLDLSFVAAHPALVLVATLGLLLLKGLVVLPLGRLFGLSRFGAAEAALALAGGGEFAFVLLNQAQASALLPHQAAQTGLAAAAVSMFLVPLATGLGARFGRRDAVAAAADLAPLQAEREPRILIVGYGRVGRLVGEMLSRHDRRWRAIDRDPRAVEAARGRGFEAFVGDASRPELLRRCGLDNATALVVTMDEPEIAEAVAASARELRPDLVIVARARDERQAERLYALGVTDAVPETVEASLQLSEAVLVEIGVPMGLVIASIHEKRDEFREGLNRPEALGGRTRGARAAFVSKAQTPH